MSHKIFLVVAALEVGQVAPKEGICVPEPVADDPIILDVWVIGGRIIGSDLDLLEIGAGAVRVGVDLTVSKLFEVR